jgi:drug/metabolite transporter (DMT)-like permease
MNLLFYSMFVSLLWGISPIAHKTMIGKMDTKMVFILNSVFYTLCIIGYTIYYWDHFKTQVPKLSSRDIYLLGGISILMSFIPNILYFYLLKDHDSYIVSALVNSAPLFTVLVSYFLLKDPITKYGIIGVLLIIGGIFCLSINEIK